VVSRAKHASVPFAGWKGAWDKRDDTKWALRGLTWNGLTNQSRHSRLFKVPHMSSDSLHRGSGFIIGRRQYVSTELAHREAELIRSCCLAFSYVFLAFVLHLSSSPVLILPMVLTSSIVSKHPGMSSYVLLWPASGSVFLIRYRCQTRLFSYIDAIGIAPMNL
jgi:hypothetical protein